ncbi:prolyl oligopeptidase family serine peptidase [Spongiactinospora sp. TRM90649]|uniref:prolyl oligopeptidase family serine peptidase n=1 Tax=Spongiactinospora sp. TRM90649 TaxID=3031114 RepID=UPI0023F9EB52|nr:prolyl oligopeptidase family serine peptidase [Spongiactinospora sp. TRM90649]MDF5751626.1 prolyl oligopeptidase family serine peptidase [Spongiactinospora sp. TRM90649]
MPGPHTTDRLHGRVVADPYRWLEDDRAGECAEWLAVQAESFARHSAAWPHTERWRALLTRASSAGTEVTPPVWRGDRCFFLRHPPERQLPVLVTVRPGEPERILLDPLATDPSALTTLDAWRPSPSGDLVAYQLSRKGDERPHLWVLDVHTGHPTDGPITPGHRTPIAWLPDDSAFFYIRTDNKPPSPADEHACGTDGEVRGVGDRELRLHTVGGGDGPALFRTALPLFTVTISPDGRLLMLSAAPGATSGNQLWLAETPSGPGAWRVPEPIHDGTAEGSRAVLKFAPGGRIYAITDSGAPFGRLCAVDPAAPEAARWRTLVGEQPGEVLADCAILTAPVTGELQLLVARSHDGSGRLSLHNAEGNLIEAFPPPGAGSISRLSAPPHGGPSAWFTYTDFVTPPALHRFDLPEHPAPEPLRPVACADGVMPPAVRGFGLLGRSDAEETPHWAGDAVARQVTYGSKDGTRVRMHLIHPAGVEAPMPVLLTAYGGFGVSTPPAYSPSVTAWVGAGGGYAVACVRGGGERGTAWHAAGSGVNKPNAIDDFVAAAEWLIEGGWTTPRQLAIRGTSHSGLMVAAALTRRPELYAAAVCSDAVTDMVRYHRFGLGPMWAAEFGTADDPAQLDVLLGYSPYHRVRPGADYPAVLLTCPRTDPRVDSLHTRKLAAALQAAAGSRGRPVVLRCEADVGHGPRSRAKWLDLQTDVLAFCAAHTGLTPGVTL